MPPLLLLILLPFLYSAITTARGIYRNYLLVRPLGLPILFAPVDPYGTAWQIICRTCPFLKRFRWARVIQETWSWQVDDRDHRALGESFVVVSPVRNLIYTSDKVAINWVLTKRREFFKPDVYENLEFFGRNVDTVNGEDWSRHRKLTAPCFNERVSGFVWDEALRQARSMLSHWLSQPNGKISNMVDDTRVIALHVLTAAGFGISHDFLGGARNPAPGHKLSHRDALMTILDNLITSIILSNTKWLERYRIVLPQRVQHIFLALREFSQYMDEMLASERKILADSQGASKPNLITTLIRTSDDAQTEGIKSAVRLTDDEIKGNIFIFNLAGHDTTANTLAYAFALLAVYPEYQTWVAEEIDEVLGDQENPKYDEAFPKLKRVMAVMYEILRLYGPVPRQPRGAIPGTLLTITHPSPTSSSPTTTLPVPPHTELSLCIHACQTSPSNFPHPSAWNPKRWIAPAASLAAETFLPAPMAYAPWSAGPRICPGMKFAQVEVAAVLATVLRTSTVVPAVKGDVEVGEEQARRMLLAQIRDSSADSGPTLNLRRPEEVCVRVLAR